MKMPKIGMTEKELFERLDAFQADDINWRSGRVFGYVFDPGKPAMEIGKKVYSRFLTENALDFSVFPSLFRFETELVSLLSTHLNGDENVVGNFTSGGTESIMLAVKAARDHFREKNPDVKTPEMILPITAHAAFHKAAHYLDVKVVPSAVDDAFKADVAAVKRAITPNTALIVGSAPSYAHGVVDPIPEMAEEAREKNILFHVDACVGGFMLPYFKRLGEAIPDFDFSVPGVTSISVDLHKYAYTPKGASLVLYRDKSIRKHQIFACSHWTGYTIINNAVQSSRSGGPMAAAWAVLHYIGDDGYLEIARKKIEATKKIIAGIEKHPDLRLMTWPDICMISFTSDTVNIFHIIDEMNEMGWYIQPALTFGNSKENIHLSINLSNVGWEEALLQDLYRCVEKAKTMPSGALAGLVKEEIGNLEPDALDDAAVSQLLEAAGVSEASLPGRMADINEVLNALPSPLREKLLIGYINDLFTIKG
ncbi:MAG: aspartate aminotransferase family protein [Desulfobacterales bacterium]